MLRGEKAASIQKAKGIKPTSWLRSSFPACLSRSGGSASLPCSSTSLTQVGLCLQHAFHPVRIASCHNHEVSDGQLSDYRDAVPGAENSLLTAATLALKKKPDERSSFHVVA